MCFFIVPISCLLGLVVVCIFKWCLVLLSISVFLLVYLLLDQSKYILYNIHFYRSSFFLFIVSEFIVFASLCYCVSLGLSDWICGFTNISFYKGYPLIACSLLGGSTISVYALHNNLCLPNSHCHFIITMSYALIFCVIQFYEYLFSPVNFSDSFYSSSCLTLVSYHCSHVIVGIIFWCYYYLYFDNPRLCLLHNYYVDYIVWYWHFVDVVWFVVFGLVYFIVN